MTTTRTPTPTEIALHDQLSENTGIHMMDSGGSSGRAWQRDAREYPRGVYDRMDRPTATVAVDWFDAALRDDLDRARDAGEPCLVRVGDRGYLDVTINTFRYLTTGIELADAMDRKLRAFIDAADQDAESPWDRRSHFELVSDWLEAMELADEIDERDDSHYATNTYNHESALDRTLQFDAFTTGDGDEAYVVLFTHNGADVRGGYSTPRVYELLHGAEYQYDLIGEEYSIYGELPEGVEGPYGRGMLSWSRYAGDGFQACNGEPELSMDDVYLCPFTGDVWWIGPEGSKYDGVRVKLKADAGMEH